MIIKLPGEIENTGYMLAIDIFTVLRVERCRQKADAG